jgi:hypothetical protein
MIQWKFSKRTVYDAVELENSQEDDIHFAKKNRCKAIKAVILISKLHLPLISDNQHYVN